MATILRLKNLFRNKEKPLSYKREHYLNQIKKEKLEDILVFSEADTISKSWPSFAQKKVLYFNDQRHKYLQQKILIEEPSHLLNYIYQDEIEETAFDGQMVVVGDFEQLSIRKSFFDVVIAPLSLKESFESISQFIGAISGLLNNNARLVLGLKHPMLENILHNQNPSSGQTQESNLSKYFDILKENHFFLEDVKEGLVDLSLKPYFTNSEYDYYHEYKNTPLSLVLKAVKFQRKK